MTKRLHPFLGLRPPELVSVEGNELPKGELFGKPFTDWIDQLLRSAQVNLQRQNLPDGPMVDVQETDEEGRPTKWQAYQAEEFLRLGSADRHSKTWWPVDVCIEALGYAQSSQEYLAGRLISVGTSALDCSAGCRRDQSFYELGKLISKLDDRGLRIEADAARQRRATEKSVEVRKQQKEPMKKRAYQMALEVWKQDPTRQNSGDVAEEVAKKIKRSSRTVEEWIRGAKQEAIRSGR